MNMCRACLSTENDLFESDDSFVCNYNLLTDLNVKPFDGKSQKFCKTCVETVNFFIDFRTKCASAESTLQEISSEQIIKTEKLDSETIIKGEIKYEYEEESYDVPVQGYDADEGNSDFIKIEIVENDVKVKKSRKKIKKQVSVSKKKQVSVCKKKQVSVCKKVAEVTATKKAEENLVLTTDKPACGLCGKIFDDAASLKNHLETHKTDRGCKLCSADTFEHWSQLLAHRVLHTTCYQNCHLCDKKFRAAPYLELHYRKEHCGENNAILKCSQCMSRFSTPRKLSKHVSSVHSLKEYHCDLCSKVCKSKQILKTHIIMHGDKKPHVCHLCGFSSKYIGGLALHNVRRHTPEKCICKGCKRPFANKEKMAKHVCLDKSKICPVCGKHLHQRDFTRHMAVHGEERKYKCELCPATYRSRSAHQVHMDKHANSPRYQCEYCNRRFYAPSVLVKHRRVHTGEKPYPCNKCEMRFTGKHNLKVHMKVHGEMLVVKKEKADTV